MNPIYAARPETRIVGNDYKSDADLGFKQEVKSVFESYMAQGVDLGSDFGAIISKARDRQEFENVMMESMTNSEAFTNSNAAKAPFYSNYAERFETLMDNSLKTVAMESVMQGYAPIVAYNPFFLKKQ